MSKKVLNTIRLSKKDRSITLIVVGVILLLFALIPENLRFDTRIDVYIHRYIFGFPCPFCGMTNAVYSLVHLGFAEAVKYNFVVFPMVIAYLLGIIFFFAPTKALRTLKKSVYIVLPISFLTLYAYRIISYFLLMRLSFYK